MLTKIVTIRSNDPDYPNDCMMLFRFNDDVSVIDPFGVYMSIVLPEDYFNRYVDDMFDKPILEVL